MGFFKKVQKLDVFWRKVILFGILFVLALPMVILIARRLAFRAAGFNGQPLFRQLGVEEMQEELGQSFLQVQEAKGELQAQMELLQEIATTSTSTDDMATNSQE